MLIFHDAGYHYYTKKVFFNTIIVLWPLMCKLDYDKISNCTIVLSVIIKNSLLLHFILTHFVLSSG